MRKRFRAWVRGLTVARQEGKGKQDRPGAGPTFVASRKGTLASESPVTFW